MYRHILLLALTAAAISPLNAQRETGSISGVIMDDSAAAVPAARILITDVANGVERTVLSNESGLYVVNALPAAQYSVSVSRDGFTTYKLSGITLQVAQQATLNVTLKVGSVAETVNVSAAAALVETRSGTLGVEIGERMVTDLPLNGRNILQLLAITPGTLDASASAFNQGATRPESAGQLISASGGRGNS